MSAPALQSVAAKLVRSSHERWDGQGYPDGLAGTSIPLGARIVSVCDAYDAMIADRPYRSGMPPSEALAELRRCAGTQFDPRRGRDLRRRDLPARSTSRAPSPPSYARVKRRPAVGESASSSLT